MLRKNESDQKTDSTTQEHHSRAESTEKKSAAALENVSRRALFSRGKALAPLGILVAAACSQPTKFNNQSSRGDASASGGDGSAGNKMPDSGNAEQNSSDNQNAKSDDDTDTTNSTETTTDTDTRKPPSTVEEKCDPTNSNEIKLEALPAASMAFVPKMKFYGRKNRALIALDFDAYDRSAAAKISKVILTHPNGKIIAVRVLTEADHLNATRLWHISFDGVNLKNSTKVVVVIVDQDEKYSKSLLETDIAFEDSFNKKPVLALSDVDCPANFWAFQAIGNFDSSNLNGFTAATDPKYNFPDPFKITDRKLYTAQSNATYAPASRISSRPFIVTDLMGNVLNNSGSMSDPSNTFSDILNHPTFICYLPLKRSADNMKYVEAGANDTVVAYCRTMLKIG